MDYPSVEQVEEASREQLCRWIRFLPSPGRRAVGSIEFQNVLNQEAQVMDRIVARWKEAGGFTPQLSKSIGWEA